MENSYLQIPHNENNSIASLQDTRHLFKIRLQDNIFCAQQKQCPRIVHMIRNMQRHHAAVSAAAPTLIDSLGPLKDLVGKWKSTGGHGWNMIALPAASQNHGFRLLMNRYDETLHFAMVDGPVPNRGVSAAGGEADQTVFALEYDQDIVQLHSIDRPSSDLNLPANSGIHHETGMFLFLSNETTDGINIARSATIPHGNSVLAMGRSRVIDGPPDIPEISGLPIGRFELGYTDAYDMEGKLFDELFDPVTPNDLLGKANAGVDIRSTTELRMDTTTATGGIHNIPFVTDQANATEMQSTFWIQELAETDRHGNPKLRLQYSQVVMLEFFPDLDGKLIRWPHVSINTLEKVVE